MSTASIAESLYAKDKTMSEEQKLSQAQEIFDAVMLGFPHLRNAIAGAQEQARQIGFTETMLGRRRHHPDMQLKEFEFVPMTGYVNPDIDPLDITTLDNKDQIPDRIIKHLEQKFASCKYYGQIVKLTKELAEEKIKVINNRSKITEASRQCWNCVDFETEILTTDGWKRYNEVNRGDSILSYNLNSQKVELDAITDVHTINEKTDVYQFESPTFSAVCTPNHRWVVGEDNEVPRIKFAENIYKNKWSDYPILRVSDNNLNEEIACKLSDDELKLLGYIMADGSLSNKYYGIDLYQSVNSEKNALVYQNTKDICGRLRIEYTENVVGDGQYSLYLRKTDFLYWIWSTFKDSTLTWEFVSTLNQHQAEVLMWSMIEGDGTLDNNHTTISICCGTKEKADVFQYLAFVAGHATNCYETIPDIHNSYSSSNRCYENLTNAEGIHITRPYYNVTVLRVKRAHIYPHHKSKSTCEGVWCVTTTNSTWVARRRGKVYITGNSIIQGSAADLTKLAMLRLENNPEWKKLGGKFIVPIHDELLVEVPFENREEGARVLKESMEGAASFLPFPITCDIEETFRWYGLSVDDILEFDKPNTMDTLEWTKSNIQWLQTRLHEMEYLLPIIPHEDGSDLRGLEAHGVNGIWTDDLEQMMFDYMNRFSVKEDEFLEHIDRKVRFGDV